MTVLYDYLAPSIPIKSSSLLYGWNRLIITYVCDIRSQLVEGRMGHSIVHSTWERVGYLPLHPKFMTDLKNPVHVLEKETVHV